MKKLFAISLVLISGIVFGQDTLSIDSTGIVLQQTNAHLDTIDFSYYPSKTGAQVSQQIRTRVNVNPGTGTDSVEATVLVDNPDTQVDFSSPAPEVNNRLVIAPAAFKNGNNTVVIWPDNGVSTSKDSIKVTIMVTEGESIEPSPLLDKVEIVNTSNGLRLTNKEHDFLSLRIFELSGKLVEIINMNAYTTASVDLKDGIYFVTFIEGNNYYLHKTRVLR